MKALSALALVAAPVAFVFVPLSFEISVSLLFAAGFVAIAFTDYARTPRPLRVPAAVEVTTSRKERFGLAA
jgi:hypothetical protein